MPEGFALCLAFGSCMGLLAGQLFYQLTVFIMAPLNT